MQSVYETGPYEEWGWANFNREHELENIDTEYKIDMFCTDKHGSRIAVQERNLSYENFNKYFTLTTTCGYQEDRHAGRPSGEFWDATCQLMVGGYQSEDRSGVVAALCINFYAFREFIFSKGLVKDGYIDNGKHPWVQKKGNRFFLRVPFLDLIDSADHVIVCKYLTKEAEKLLSHKRKIRRVNA